MENSQEMLSKLKVMCLKNKGKLQEFSNFISHHDPIPQPALAHFPLLKQQYQIILTASKESIDRNSQLQAQLQSKQQYARNLKEKLNKHSRELQDLSHEVVRANGNLKKQRKSKRELLTSEDTNQKLKRDAEKLAKKKNELIRQCDLLNRKQQDLKAQISQLTSQTLQIELRSQKQEGRSGARVEQLLRDIKMCRQNVSEQKNMKTSRAVTPDKSSEKKRNLAEMELMIKQFKERSMMM